MSAADTSGFGKFIPGFDFLKNLSKSAGNLPQMPNLANWVAPTLNVEELDKRISELKNVHFWLEQNTRALSATIQALEVQKMTLATLKGMNFNIADVAAALTPRAAAADATPSRAEKAAAQAAEAAAAEAQAAALAAAAARASAREASAAPADEATASAGKPGAAGMVDPLQLWGSLTQQFQQIAASAVKEVAASHAAGQAAAAQAVKQAEQVAKQAAEEVAKQVARQTAPRAKAATPGAKSAPAKTRATPKSPSKGAVRAAVKRSGVTQSAARKTSSK